MTPDVVWSLLDPAEIPGILSRRHVPPHGCDDLPPLPPPPPWPPWPRGPAAIPPLTVVWLQPCGCPVGDRCGCACQTTADRIELAGAPWLLADRPVQQRRAAA